MNKVQFKPQYDIHSENKIRIIYRIYVDGKDLLDMVTKYEEPMVEKENIKKQPGENKIYAGHYIYQDPK